MSHDEPTGTAEASDQDTNGGEQTAEVLVEEISIDGMCGVY
jgi:mycofactocin precursor